MKAWRIAELIHSTLPTASLHPPSFRYLFMKGSFEHHFLAKGVDRKDLYLLVSFSSDKQKRQALPEKSLFCVLYL